MRSICFFAAYFTSRDLPYYIQVYLKELKKQFGKVVLLCSQKELSGESRSFLGSEGIVLQVEENEGFDFGLWYKAFNKYDIGSYDKIALVNDSCILFKPLDEFMSWTRSDNSDMQGMTLSDAIAPHLQSYFLILNKKAINLAREYFRQHKLLNTLEEVIHTYEIGLSSHLIAKGLKISAFVDNNGYSGEFSPYYKCVVYHLKKQMPLIKKKILFSSYRKDELLTLARMNFRINPQFYVSLIKQSNSTLILDFEKLRNDQIGEISLASKIKFTLTRFLVKIKSSNKNA